MSKLSENPIDAVASSHFAQVDDDYRHVSKEASPTTALVLPGATLKWYLVHPAGDPFAGENVREAQQHVARDVDQGRIAMRDEVGFVVQHRCAGRDILYVCSWRGNNEVWETIYSKPRVADGRFEIAHRPLTTGTFCVWVIPMVAHEQQAWVRYLKSRRDAGARRKYLGDQFSGTVG